MDRPTDLYLRLSGVVRALREQDDLPSTMQRSAAAAVELVEGCASAGLVWLRGGGTLESVAATDPRATAADVRQVELGSGPAIDALDVAETVIAVDLRTEDRWPGWVSYVREELGIDSAVAIRLFTGDRSIGVLTLYAAGGRLDDASVREAYLLAACVSVAVDAAHTEHTLEEAAASRATIGQAQGILMERFEVDADQAFAVLKRVSQDRNIKLNRLARETIQTRRTPGVDRDGAPRASRREQSGG